MFDTKTNANEQTSQVQGVEEGSAVGSRVEAAKLQRSNHAGKQERLVSEEHRFRVQQVKTKSSEIVFVSSRHIAAVPSLNTTAVTNLGGRMLTCSRSPATADATPKTSHRRVQLYPHLFEGI